MTAPLTLSTILLVIPLGRATTEWPQKLPSDPANRVYWE
jgi:hypothetical protein